MEGAEPVTEQKTAWSPPRGGTRSAARKARAPERGVGNSCLHCPSRAHQLGRAQEENYLTNYECDGAPEEINAFLGEMLQCHSQQSMEHWLDLQENPSAPTDRKSGIAHVPSCCCFPWKTFLSLHFPPSFRFMAGPRMCLVMRGWVTSIQPTLDARLDYSAILRLLATVWVSTHVPYHFSLCFC